jgi:hypothetical protein
MKPQGLFEALARVAREHEESAGSDRLLVIPILTDELESRKDLLREVAEFLGGTLLDVSGNDFHETVAGYEDPVLQGVVEQELTFDRPGVGHARVAMSLGDGQADAKLFIQENEVAAPSKAESKLLAIARSLFDARLKEDELAILSYEENAFDEPTQRAVLSLLTGLGRQDGLTLGGVRTLIPLIRASALNPARHCQLYRGVRFSITDAELIQRNPPQHLFGVVRKVTADRPPPPVLFLGAGFSVSSGMPIGNRMRNLAIQRICEITDIADLSDEELGCRLFRYGQENGLLAPRETSISEEEFARQATLEQAIRIERDAFAVPITDTIKYLQQHHNGLLADGAASLGPSVLSLQSIIRRRPRLVLVTVNFDELVEYDCDEFLDILVDDTEFDAAKETLMRMAGGESHPENRVPLLKLHGTINRPETCVATDDATRSGISRAKDEALRGFVESVPVDHRAHWVYVGASMRDIDLNATFTAQAFNTKVSEYWVAPWLERSVAEFVYSKQRWWVSRGEPLLDRVVTETADSFARVLEEKWPDEGS